MVVKMVGASTKLPLVEEVGVLWWIQVAKHGLIGG